MEHTYFTCDRCNATFQHRDPMNALYVVFPKKVEPKAEKTPFEKLFGSDNIVMIPFPGVPMPAPKAEEVKWPENWKEMCPDCQIEFVRWWNKDMVVEKRYV